MEKNQFWKVKNSLLELEKDFKNWKTEKLKLKEIEELFFKSIIVSTDETDKFFKKMKKAN